MFTSLLLWIVDAVPCADVITSNIRKSVFSGLLSTKMWVEKISQVFLTDFKVLGDLIKLSFECLIYLLKLIILCREKERIKSPKSILIN